jgi:hypothetical protein
MIIQLTSTHINLLNKPVIVSLIVETLDGFFKSMMIYEENSEPEPMLDKSSNESSMSISSI